MRFADYKRGYVIQLEPGEEFQESLGTFVKQKRIPSAFFQGIGALSQVDLGFFDLAKNEYERHFFEEEYELITANGNVSMENDVPFVHTHVVPSDQKCQTIGGHLFKGTVTITAEIFLFTADIALLRKPNPDLNFRELDLPHHFVR